MEYSAICTKRYAQLSQKAADTYNYYTERADEDGIAWVDEDSWESPEFEELIENQFLIIIGEGRVFVVTNAYLFDVFRTLMEG